MQARALLPEATFLAMSNIIAQLSAHPLTTVRVCLGLLGHMAACTYMVRHARLCLRYILCLRYTGVSILPVQVPSRQVTHDSTTNTYFPIMVDKPAPHDGKGAICGMRGVLTHLSSKIVHIFTDNTAIMHYINRWGEPDPWPSVRRPCVCGSSA